MSVKQEFESRFISEVVLNKGTMSDELDVLFNQVLEEEFSGDPELMDEYITGLHQIRHSNFQYNQKTNIEKAVIKIAEKMNEEDAKDILDILNGMI